MLQLPSDPIIYHSFDTVTPVSADGGESEILYPPEHIKFQRFATTSANFESWHSRHAYQKHEFTFWIMQRNKNDCNTMSCKGH